MHITIDPEAAPSPALGERSGAPSGLRPSTFVMSDTPVEVQFTSTGCLNYPCRTPVLQADRHRPQPRRYLAQVVVALGAHQRPEDRAQPEIDAGLGPEFIRPERQRIDRGDDLRTGAGVEREIAPLLDQRLRQRFGERALGRRKANGSLLPSLPPSSRAVSVMTTSAPAQGWSVTSLMVCATPFLVRACGRTSEKSGGPYSGCGLSPFAAGSSLRAKGCRAVRARFYNDEPTYTMIAWP